MLTVVDAANAGGCSRTLIGRLLREGKLQGHRAGKTWVITMTRAEIKEAVGKHAPLSGFKKRPGGLTKIDPAIAGLLAWAQIPPDKRAPLLRIAERFDAATLEIIATL